MTDYPFEEKYSEYCSWYRPRNSVTERMTHKIAKEWVKWMSELEPSSEHSLSEFASQLPEEYSNFLINYVLCEPNVLIPLALDFNVVMKGDLVERLIEQPAEISDL